MRQEHQHYHASLQAVDERIINPCQAAGFGTIINCS